MKRGLSLFLALLLLFSLCACQSKVEPVSTPAPTPEATKTPTVAMPLAEEEFVGLNYLEAEKKLKVLGFDRVTLEEYADLTSKEAEKDGTVRSVTIGNTAGFRVGDVFKTDEAVVLEYHTLRRASLPLSAAELNGMEPEEAEKRLRDAGFVNVRTETVEDGGPEDQPYRDVTIDGAGKFSRGDEVPFDAEILILTHLPAAAPGPVELTAEQIYASCAPAVFYMEIYDEYGWCIKTGSGFFLTEDGIAVTNYHVISGAATASIVLSDTGEEYAVLGVYDSSVEEDWAILQIEGEGFRTLEVGDQDYDVGGATVYAIGSPLGLQNTISEGIISNPHRMDNGMNFIQMSAAISPGSSGGALLNKYGQVIGITSATYTEGQNLNLAIPMTYLADAELEAYVPLRDTLAGPSGVLTLVENSVRVSIGGEYDVGLTAIEQNCTGVSVRYSILDESIVSCAWQGWQGDDNTLRITGLTAGSTEVTVYFLISESETVLDSKTIQVTVTPEGEGEGGWEADLEDVEFWLDVDSLSLSLFAGGELHVHAVYPPDDDNTYVSWFADDPSLFAGEWGSWDEEGNTVLYLQPQSAGSTELSIGYLHDDGTLLAMRTITLNIFYAALEVSADEIGLEEGESFTVTVTIRSDNPGLHTLRYEVYGEDIVSCSWGDWNEDGISCPLTVTGLEPGEADVEINLLDKETQQFLFSVSIPVYVEG